MAICTALVTSIVIYLLVIGSSVDGYDKAKETEALRSKISTLELSNVKEAEKKLQELKLSFEQLQRTNDEQARALELAEKELKRVKLETSSKFEKLTANLEVSFWKQRAKQSIIALINKTTEKMVHAKIWSEPHMGSAKTKWVPAVMQQFEIFTNNMVPYMKELSTQTIEKAKSTMKPSLEKVQEMTLPDYKKWVPAAKQQLETIMIDIQPYMRKLVTKTIEVCEVSKSTMKTHYDKVQEMTLSYYKEAWSYLMPYIDQLLKPYLNQFFIITKPYVEKLQNSLKLLTEYAARMYCKHSGRNNTHRTQVKSNIDEHPRKHKLTRVYATLASVMAYVLFAFSVVFLCRFLQSIFITKKRKQLKRTFHASEPHRKPKRRRADI